MEQAVGSEERHIDTPKHAKKKKKKKECEEVKIGGVRT